MRPPLLRMFTCAILCLVAVHPARGVDGDYKEAMRVRSLLHAEELPLGAMPHARLQDPPVAETVLLPVSRGFNQRSTGLCWAYATLSALETIHLVRTPDGPDVELSRRAVQYYTMEDRYRRSIKQLNTDIREGGIVLDALRLIQSNGIVSFDDYADVADPYGYANIAGMIAGAPTFTDKIIALYEGLDIVYTAPPTQTHVPVLSAVEPNATYAPADVGELARFVLGHDVWQSYTPSSIKNGFHAHPDPDARWENASWHMPHSEFPGRIRRALMAGFPVVISIRNHALLVYGADYDAAGSPITYYIKDSYPPYYYVTDANYLHASFWEMTTVEL